jgi:hypothetical protein
MNFKFLGPTVNASSDLLVYRGESSKIGIGYLCLNLSYLLKVFGEIPISITLKLEGETNAKS